MTDSHFGCEATKCKFTKERLKSIKLQTNVPLPMLFIPF